MIPKQYISILGNTLYISRTIMVVKLLFEKYPKKYSKNLRMRKKKSLSNDLTLTNSQDNIVGECCICFRESKVLYDHNDNKILKLNEYEDNNKLSDDVIFFGPCGVHQYCVYCLKTLSLSFDNHSINENNPLIPCQPPMEKIGCMNSFGMLNYFTHNDIKKVLNDEEFKQYTNHADRYQFPGYELVRCPRPLYRNNIYEVCDAGILVPIDHIRNAQRGHMIIYCDQNEDCNRKSCYHCQNLISRHSRECQYCITVCEANDPRALNRYFYNPNKAKKDGSPIMFRNEELTTEIVINQLCEIVDTDKGYIKCLECLVPMFKTEQCNTMSHCGIERCYCCGRSGTVTQDLGDHWDTTGIHGCPRFDHSRYWNEFADCNFICQENECYSEELGDCTLSNHQIGIQNMHNERCKIQIYHGLRSLLPLTRDLVLKEMYQNLKLKPFIPKYISSDHRTCNADTLYNFFISVEHNDIENRDEYLNLFTKVEFEKPKITPPPASTKRPVKMQGIISDLWNRYILRDIV